MALLDDKWVIAATAAREDSGARAVIEVDGKRVPFYICRPRND
jgi:hypothetical protein